MAMQSGLKWNMYLFTSQGILIGPLLITRNCLALSQISFTLRPRVTFLDQGTLSTRLANRDCARKRFQRQEEGWVHPFVTHAFFYIVSQ